MKINRLWVIMSSKKEIFESYLGKLGLNKTVVEAVKDINGVLFESSIDDLLGNFDVSDVPETLTDEPEISEVKPSEEPAKPEGDKDYKRTVLLGDAIRMAYAWAHDDPRFDNLWDDNNSAGNISFMTTSDGGQHQFFSPDKVMYVVNAEGEGDVEKYTYKTLTNDVKMSQNVYDQVLDYYGGGDLSDVPFDEIKHLVMGNSVHKTGENPEAIESKCTVEIDPSATVLTTSVDEYIKDDQGRVTEIVPNKENRELLGQKYGLPVDNLDMALVKEWLGANDRYYMDGGVIYDKTPTPSSKEDLPTLTPNRATGKKESSLKLNAKVIDWARTQDMFKLLLKPNAAGIPKLVYSNTIYKVPNDGNIEGVVGNTPYVYMDDDNYASYISTNPEFDQSKVQKFGVDTLNTIVSTEYKDRSLTDTSSGNAFGYDENGWVDNLECELVDYGVYALKSGIDTQIRKAYGRNIDGLNNYVAGKNVVVLGGHQDLDGNVTGGTNCHPLVFLERRTGGYLRARLVALFDESCCKPGESLTKIVGKDGLRGGAPTIHGFATILNNCNLEKSGPFVINQCILSNVDISESTGFVKIGTTGNVPKKTEVTNTIIRVGNNGADQALPNNRVAGEMSNGLRGVSIINSVISNSHIENGYADIYNCHLTNLVMDNEGPKVLKEWNTDDASNVEFKGGNTITIYGNAKYRTGSTKSVVAGASSTAEYESSEVVTSFTGDVVLDSSAGDVICKGSTMNNVVANGPCNIRTCTLKGTTVGVNADAGGDFKMTLMACVNTSPVNDGAGCIQIEHGRTNPTIFGNSFKDMTPGMIELSGRVFVEGGAQVFKSVISSADESQEAYVRSNMTLSGCMPYSLNSKDSGMLSKYLHGDDRLTGDCTDVRHVANALQREFNEFGGSTERATPFEKYEKFKAGDMSMKDLTLFESKSIVEDFLAQNTGAVLMNKSVFMDITEDGAVVPNLELKKTIWDPIGGFFAGPVNKSADGVTAYGGMILLKCPNVVLDHQAIIKKKHEFGQSLDYNVYSSGKISLRQYVDFLENNGYYDCFYYVDEKGEKTSVPNDFVQLCLISKKDMRTPHKLSIDQMKVLENNAKRAVGQFKATDTTSATNIRDVDTIDNITTAYTIRGGGMVVETDRGRYEYTAPRVDDVGKKIQSTCSRRWRDDEGKTHTSTTTVDCGVDAMYNAGYQYLVKSHTSANANELDIIKRALSGNTEGLQQRDYLSAAVNAMSGNEMKSENVDSVEDNAINKILKLLSLEDKEKVYYLESDAKKMVFLAKGKLIAPKAAERMSYENAGCKKMSYRPISYDRESGRFIVDQKRRIYPVKLRNNIQPSAVHMEHMLAREATLDDFIRLLGVPDPRV